MNLHRAYGQLGHRKAKIAFNFSSRSSHFVLAVIPRPFIWKSIVQSWSYSVVLMLFSLWIEMAPCLFLGSFAFCHFWSITAVIPGQAFLFFMTTPHKNVLAMAGIQCSVFPWMDSEAWSGSFLHWHGWRGQHPGWADFISLWAFSQVRREWDQL